MMIVNSKDLGAGMAFIAVAAIYGGTALRTLPMGTITNMGPAYFPIVLCVVLLMLGLVLVVRGLFSDASVRIAGSVAWRPILTISAAVIFFGTFIRQVGFGPALLVASFLCALATRRTSVAEAAMLALVFTLFCVGVFIYGVRLPFPVFGPWLAG